MQSDIRGRRGGAPRGDGVHRLSENIEAPSRESLTTSEASLLDRGS